MTKVNRHASSYLCGPGARPVKQTQEAKQQQLAGETKHEVRIEDEAELLSKESNREGEGGKPPTPVIEDLDYGQGQI